MYKSGFYPFLVVIIFVFIMEVSVSSFTFLSRVKKNLMIPKCRLDIFLCLSGNFKMKIDGNNTKTIYWSIKTMGVILFIFY